MDDAPPLSQLESKPRQRRLFLSGLGLVMLIGITISVVLFGVVRTLENERIAMDLEASVANQVSAVQRVLLDQRRLLESVAAYLVASRDVTAGSFKTFVAPLLHSNPQLQAISYAPFVPMAERERFEHEVAATNETSGYRIVERVTSGESRPAGIRDGYVPVLFMEPSTGNEAANGFDLMSEPKRRAAIEAARDSGELRTTLALDLVQDRRSRQGFLSALPVYRSGASLTNSHDRQAALAGFATQVYRSDEMIEKGLAQLRPTGIDLYFIDPDQSPEQELIYFHGSRLREPDSGTLDSLPDMSSRFIAGGELDVGNRSWQVIALPTPIFIANRRGPLAWVFLTGGLGATVLLLAYLAATARRKRILHNTYAELAFSNARLQEVLQNMPVLMNAFDAEGNLIVWNSECERVTGYAAAEVIGKRDVLNSKFAAPSPLDQMTVATQGSADFRDQEQQLTDKQGEQRTIAWSNVSAAIPIPGWASWFIGIDVTGRKRADSERDAIQEKMLFSQKLESLGVMAGGIAHDFNNLLTAIMGHASVAQIAVDATSPAQAPLAEVVSASERAALLTQQLLAYTGKATLEIVPIDLSSQVREVGNLLRAAIPKKVELRLHLTDGLPAVDADPSRFQQLVMNLVINAAEAVDGIGVVDVRSGLQHLDAPRTASLTAGAELAPGTYVCLQVEDNGAGMDAATKARIFDPFYTTKFTGRGLGLAAAVGIVRAHHGSIEVSSTPGRGSTFSVFLPISERDALPVHDEPTIDLKGEGLILVVDDEPMILQFVQSTLGQFGYGVLTAQGGGAAIEYFKSRSGEIACVLLDKTMPDLDGEETLLRLRAIDPEVVAILSSGYTESSATTQLGGQEPSGFLQKPYTGESLARKLKQVLAAARAGTPA